MNLDQARNIFIEKHELLSKLMQYPPFSINVDLKRAFNDELYGDPETDGGDNITTPEQMATFYDGVMKSFEQELEEASLWLSRYPLDRYEAAQAALELEGVPDWKIELRLPFV